jgi:hypothetical protein
MQQKIFEDLAWQHQAYVEGGLPALEAAYQRGDIKEKEIIQAWRDIASGDENRQWRGNTTLLHREQYDILRLGYEKIRNRTTSLSVSKFPPVSLPIDSGKLIAGAMSQMAESLVPGGRSFREVTGDKTDITLFNVRWDWIKDDMLPAYRNISPAQVRRLLPDRLFGCRQRRMNAARQRLSARFPWISRCKRGEACKTDYDVVPWRLTQSRNFKTGINLHVSRIV